MFKRSLPFSKLAQGTGTAHARKACDFKTVVELIIGANTGNDDDSRASVIVATAVAVFGIDRFRDEYMSMIAELERQVYAEMSSDTDPESFLRERVCRVSKLDGALCMANDSGFDVGVNPFASDRLFALAMSLWPGHNLYNGAQFGAEFSAVQWLREAQ